MNILLAIDDSPCSQAAVESVIKRPWPSDTKVHVLSVVEPFHPEYAGWHTSYVPLALEAQKERVESVRKLVEENAQRLKSRLSAECVTFEAAEGYIKDKILDKAVAWPADLIVMGSHGRRGLEKWLLGSVSQAVVAHAPCSVEIVRMERSAAEAAGSTLP